MTIQTMLTMMISSFQWLTDSLDVSLQSCHHLLIKSKSYTTDACTGRHCSLLILKYWMNGWMGNENESNQSSNQSRNQINGFKLFLLSYFPTFCSDLGSVFVNRVLNKSVKYPIAQTTVTKQVIGLDHRSDPEAWWLQRSLLIQLPI